MVEKSPDMLRTSPINSQYSNPGMTPSCESNLPIALHKAMQEEMLALEKNDTWDLVPLPSGDDVVGVQKFKSNLQANFQTKNLGYLQYFLGIEVVRSKYKIYLCQRKYVVDMLNEIGMLGCRLVDTLMDPNVKLVGDQSALLDDSRQYRILVGKLNYFTVTRPDISFAVSVVNQFLDTSRTSHWDAVIRILRYLKSAPEKGFLYQNHGHTNIEGYSDADWAGSVSDRRSTTGYCVFVGGNLVSWKSKKQTVVSKSSAESEYRAMNHTVCELVWLKSMLLEIGFEHKQPMNLVCDNQAVVHITSNQVFHERTKHIEVDCHFIREKLLDGVIKTSHVPSVDRLADLFTKSLGCSRVKYICNKLGAYDIYAST
ncbi:uncharacterized mitochondrial protein AtMg00810-like [Coffea arabica]|uniref:Uncharacterized mitochondrial protein AtMg00810-like n=1 Tax=Coffea arabica TaxID=13443 RepID=A0ABM4UY28_COFAR